MPLPDHPDLRARRSGRECDPFGRERKAAIRPSRGTSQARLHRLCADPVAPSGPTARRMAGRPRIGAVFGGADPELRITGVVRAAAQAPQGAARWTHLAVGNALVFLCLATPLLLAGELYFRFVYDTTDSLAYTRVCERWEQRHWHVNRAGCRDDVRYSPALTPGKRRISFLGDSFTAGHGIKDVEDRSQIGCGGRIGNGRFMCWPGLAWIRAGS